jgi:hypothetical protein
MKEEDFRVLLVMDEHTLHASNILKSSFISSVPDYPVPRDNSGYFYFTSDTLLIAYGIYLEMLFDSLHKASFTK